MSEPSQLSSKNWTIAAATPDQITAACQTLYAHFPASERPTRIALAETLFRSGEIDVSEVLLAMHGRTVCGTGYVHVSAGAQASVWLPRVTPGWESDSHAIETALAEAYRERLHARQVKVAQLLIDTEERNDCRALRQVGFQAITQITTLRRELRDPAGSPEAKVAVTLEPANAADSRIGSLLLTTYEGTLDCPELNGLRTADEIVAGYEDSGTPRWYTIRFENADIGVVILTAGLQPGEIELSYVGLHPSARGRGLGRAAVKRVMEQARSASASTITVTVDVRNIPAIQLYESFGFREFETQDVYLWFNS